MVSVPSILAIENGSASLMVLETAVIAFSGASHGNHAIFPISGYSLPHE